MPATKPTSPSTRWMCAAWWHRWVEAGPVLAGSLVTSRMAMRSARISRLPKAHREIPFQVVIGKIPLQGRRPGRPPGWCWRRTRWFLLRIRSMAAPALAAALGGPVAERVVTAGERAEPVAPAAGVEAEEPERRVGPPAVRAEPPERAAALEFPSTIPTIIFITSHGRSCRSSRLR